MITLLEISLSWYIRIIEISIMSKKSCTDTIFEVDECIVASLTKVETWYVSKIVDLYIFMDFRLIWDRILYFYGINKLI